MKRKYCQQSWFTLIEVIIASAILSITVFWVYKLIWENSKLINNSDNYLQLNNLFLNLQECVQNKKLSFINEAVWYEQKINFWSDFKSCKLWNSNPVSLDNIDYFLDTKIIKKEEKYIILELVIEWDWVWIEKKEFILKF